MRTGEIVGVELDITMSIIDSSTMRAFPSLVFREKPDLVSACREYMRRRSGDGERVCVNNVPWAHLSADAVRDECCQPLIPYIHFPTIFDQFLI